jgi:hypothetical protein
MKSRICLAAIATACAALAVVPGVASAGTLDQQQTDDTAGFGVGATLSIAQTFTAGITGDLDGVDLSLAKNNAPTVPLTVEIRDVFPGFIGTTALASASIPASAVAAGPLAFVAIAFATPVPVSTGSHYAIVVHANTAFPDTYSWGHAGSDLYAGGTALTSAASPPNNNWFPQALDQAFKTYVVPAPGSTPAAASGPTGLRAAALKKCKKKKSKKARKKCKKKALLLPA